jgi:hypothetical protein
MKIKKVPQEILDQIQLIKQKKEYVIKELGEIVIITEELEDRKQLVLEYRRTMLEEESTLSKYLSKEYGNGTLNTDTGEFTPIQ